MSVRLDEFCETSQSKFAEALKVALRNAVFSCALGAKTPSVIMPY